MGKHMTDLPPQSSILLSALFLYLCPFFPWSLTLPIYCLFNNAVINSNYTVLNGMKTTGKWILKVSNEWSWPNLRYYPSVCIDRLGTPWKTWCSEIQTGHLTNTCQNRKHFNGHAKQKNGVWCLITWEQDTEWVLTTVHKASFRIPRCYCILTVQIYIMCSVHAYLNGSITAPNVLNCRHDAFQLGKLCFHHIQFCNLVLHYIVWVTIWAFWVAIFASIFAAPNAHLWTYIHEHTHKHTQNLFIQQHNDRKISLKIALLSLYWPAMHCCNNVGAQSSSLSLALFQA